MTSMSTALNQIIQIWWQMDPNTIANSGVCRLSMLELTCIQNQLHPLHNWDLQSFRWWGVEHLLKGSTMLGFRFSQHDYRDDSISILESPRPHYLGHADVCHSTVDFIQEMRGGDPVWSPHHHNRNHQHIPAKNYSSSDGQQRQINGQPAVFPRCRLNLA